MRKLILLILLLVNILHGKSQGKYGVNWAVGRGNTYIYNFDNLNLKYLDTSYKYYFNLGFIKLFIKLY